jgi:hypothetical protein
MTELLTPRPSRATRRQAVPAGTGTGPRRGTGTGTGAGTGDDARRRPLAVTAVLAGAAAPAAVLMALWTVGLAGWYAADGGTHGSTQSVLRVAADGWLLAHGASLTLRDVTVTASPLGLTLLCAWVAYLLGRWAGHTSHDEDLRSVGLAAVAMAGVYAVLALVTSLLAAAPEAEPALGAAFLGGAVVGGAAGGLGLVRGAGLGGALRRSIPVPALAVGYGALAVVALLSAAGALLVAVALALHGPAAANVAEGLHLDLTGGLLSVLLVAAIGPNLALLAVTYLLGPGFALGAGTVVSPAEVSLGPVPAVPVLAALPREGWTPGWVLGLLAVPVLVGLASAYLAGRTLPSRSYQTGALRGLAAGALGSLLLAVATSYAGGAIGSGRMTEIGAGFGATLLAGLLSVAPAAALGGVLATWDARRRDVPEARHGEPATSSLTSDAPVVARPLAGPDDLTEPVHLPKVTVEDRLAPQAGDEHHDRTDDEPEDRTGEGGPAAPGHTDLTTEDTVQIRLPRHR